MQLGQWELVTETAVDPKMVELNGVWGCQVEVASYEQEAQG